MSSNSWKCEEALNQSRLYPMLRDSVPIQSITSVVVVRFTFHPSCFSLNSPFHSQIGKKNAWRYFFRLCIIWGRLLKKQYHARVMTVPVYVFYHMDETRTFTYYKSGIAAMCKMDLASSRGSLQQLRRFITFFIAGFISLLLLRFTLKVRKPRRDFRISYFLLPTSGFRLVASGFRLPASSLRLLTSGFWVSTSDFGI